MQLTLDLHYDRRYRRKPFETSDLRQVRELYLKQNLPGKEVAKIMGRSYGSFKLFLNRNPELQKRGKC
ncbi:hypothetical protein GCM10023188_25950 [Pontibacter saemangeumensis]|uniref:Homeodomain-like domain-containing protein n=1 Tax=Pontibacter saemangeumensis TaxID=1084525 RepID=A0ABP8LUE4_9BACT